MKRLPLSFLIVVAAIFGKQAAADEMTLRIADQTDRTYEFYHILLEQAFEQAGHKLTLIKRTGLPQKRIIALFEHGELDIHWMLESKERNEKYQAIPVGLTGGLAGHRVLLISPEQQSQFDPVKTLDDFRNMNLAGGFGENWFDIDVWRLNKLSYTVAPGDWRSIFSILQSEKRRQISNIHYFSRAVTEVELEIAQYPALVAEQNLMFIYDRDFKFFLNRNDQSRGPLLTAVMEHAQKSGLIEDLVNRYYGASLENLHLDQRTKFILETPR
ncbi:hypothetical protein [Aestuariispira insulae]|uniref:Extracellular solute-binding protein (Family 3) n=1 Tax=Aestuariispira insulae TaxID=1461337 RepID=A0A3D9HWE8_9PROT|nr:hypothetical protein [Aestuariispira insulae]RED53797.1 hypothetical protein DFP90_101596 [Aestuariispira insulae]